MGNDICGFEKHMVLVKYTQCKIILICINVLSTSLENSVCLNSLGQGTYC